MDIHLGWLGGDPPPKALDAVARVRAQNPRDTVHFWTDDSAVWPAWRSQLEAVAYSQHLRSDLLRHSVLRSHGGIWLDVDVVTMAPAAKIICGWTGYTAVRLAPSPFIGTDILYVEPGWGGWGFVDAYILGTSLAKPVAGLVLANDMILSCRRAGCPMTVVTDRTAFPCIDGDASPAATALRCGLQPQRPGLGDMVAAGLSAVGITKERVSKAIGRPCGCAGRQAALNKLGQKLGLPPGQTPPAS